MLPKSSGTAPRLRIGAGAWRTETCKKAGSQIPTGAAAELMPGQFSTQKLLAVNIKLVIGNTFNYSVATFRVAGPVSAQGPRPAGPLLGFIAKGNELPQLLNG